jgi:hypothetical protein
MFEEHYPPLVCAYALGLVGWLLASRTLPRVWPRKPLEGFARPWRELGIALVAALLIPALGLLWSRGLRLPEHGALGPVGGALNQVLIFSPILLVPILRRQPWTSAWLPQPYLATRLLVGLVLSTLALAAYSCLRAGAPTLPAWLTKVWSYDHLDEMAQVLLEDLAIAILFVRLSGAVGSRAATVLVACLFAAGHIPAMVSQGATGPELAALLGDAALGVAVLLVLQRSRDVVWFWCLHFALDMTQF